MDQVWTVAPRRRKKKANREKVCQAVCLSFGFGVCLVGAVIAFVMARQEGSLPFHGHMAEYLAPVRDGGSLHYGDVKGKMVVVDVDTRNLDPVHFDLPERMRARSHTQVAYVARLKWEKALDGVYVQRHWDRGQLQETGPRFAAIRWDCQIELVEKGTGRHAAMRIRGGTPETTRPGDGTGPKRTDLVLDYLVRMAAAPGK